MSVRLFCASGECVHNKDNECHAGKISLSDMAVTTKYQGRMHLWECKQYMPSEEFVRMGEEIKKILEKENYR